MKLQYARWWSLGVIGSGILLVLMVALMFFPICSNEALATDEVSPQADMASNITVPSISVALSPRTEIDVTPTANGSFGASVATLKVAVNLPSNYGADGYKVYMATKNGNTLKGSSGNSTVINPVSANSTKTSFTNNTWGYSLNETGASTVDTAVYQPVPASNTMIHSSSQLSGDYDLSFALKVDTTIPTDQYSNSVIVSVVAGPEKVLRFEEITTMQEMKPGICATATTPAVSATVSDTDGSHAGDTNYVPENTLTDTRDGKAYKVRKLADGNCWMVQDLNFVLSTSKTLTSADTDLPEGTSWTPDLNTWTELSTLVVGSEYDEWAKKINRSYTNGAHTYYYWRAATAGTTGQGIPEQYQNAPGSVCPKGWTLPTEGDYSNLVKTKYKIPSSSTGSAKVRSAPLDFNYTGRYSMEYSEEGGQWGTYYGVLEDEDSQGNYWSRTASIASSSDLFDAYLFYFDNRVNVSSSRYEQGVALRCVAR